MKKHAALLLGIIATVIPVAARSAAPLMPSANSHNWAGYEASGTGFSAISGSWNVSSPGATSTTAGDATWVGIGGMQSADLIQVGTRALIADGAVSYEAWYELLPRAAVPVPLSISAGDTIDATVLQTAPDEWRITLLDASTGKQFVTTLSYHSSESSAEWVEEAGGDGTKLTPLDQFSPVTFTNASAAQAGQTRSLAALKATRLTLVTTSLEALATASPVSTGGASFVVSRD